MAECLKTRRDGALYSLPTLNTAYPQDVSLIESASGSATFKVSILIDGKPAEYTYQWYVNNSAVSGATSSTYTKSGLTSTGTYSVYCNVTNKAGTVKSRVATLTVKSSKPTYTYTGSHSLIDDGNYNWRIKFTTSGTLNFSYLGNASNGIDVFCVGAGGGGSKYDATWGGGAGGGGGYTITSIGVPVSIGTNYTITIGAGGSGATRAGNAGGATSAFNISASGGKGALVYGGGAGGSGGGSAGDTASSVAGGTNGGNGGGTGGGQGQGTTTREFGNSSATLYAGGGAGAHAWWDDIVGVGGAGGGGNTGKSGTVNTGGGGGGCGSWPNGGVSNWAVGTGGSGVVVIRNH